MASHVPGRSYSGESGRGSDRCPTYVESPPGTPDAPGDPAGVEPPADDLILAWLTPAHARADGSEPPLPEAACSACGYCGEAVVVAGHLVCPVCSDVLAIPVDAAVCKKVPCPDCRLEIELREADRNKTIICPRCKYFIGCVVRSPSDRTLEVFGIPLRSLFAPRPSRRSGWPGG